MPYADAFHVSIDEVKVWVPGPGSFHEQGTNGLATNRMAAGEILEQLSQILQTKTPCTQYRVEEVVIHEIHRLLKIDTKGFLQLIKERDCYVEFIVLDTL